MTFFKKQIQDREQISGCQDLWIEKCSYKGVPQGSFGAAEAVLNPDFGRGYTNQSILVMLKATQDQK